MKKSLVIVVCLLSLSVVIASVQLTKATITNATNIGIHSTDPFFLTLKPIHGVGNEDGTCVPCSSQKGNYLTFNFAKGFGGKLFGLQKNSTYIWDVTEKTDQCTTDGLFEIGQQLNQDIKVKIEAVDIPTGVSLFFKLDKPSWDTSSQWIEMNESNQYTIDAIPLLKANNNDAIGVAVKLSIADHAVCNGEISHMQIIVSSEVLDKDDDINDSPAAYDSDSPTSEEPTPEPIIQALPHTK